MTKRSLPIGCFGVVLAMLIGICSARADDVYPVKPIKVVVPTAPGGAIDLTTRLIAQKMSEYLKQTILVENRPGGSTLLGTRIVKEAAPDGYTLLSQANGMLTLPILRSDSGYDPLKDFVPIGGMTFGPMIMDVGVDSPYRTLADFVAAAKARPGEIVYAVGDIGGASHLAAASFLRAANLKLTVVPYKGNGPALVDVAASRVAMIFDGYNSSSAFLKASKMRVLAQTGTKRVGVLADVPTFRELGYDYDYTLWIGLLAPAGTPNSIVQRIADALHYATSDKELTVRFAADGVELVHDTPESFAKYLETSREPSEALVRALNIRSQ